MPVRPLWGLCLVLIGCGSTIELENEDDEGPPCIIGECGDRCTVCESEECYAGVCNEDARCVKSEGPFDCSGLH